MPRCEAITAKSQYMKPHRCWHDAYGPRFNGRPLCRAHAAMARRGVKLKFSRSKLGSIFKRILFV